jgi:methylated-DNA-[protein]-cysteine S-methyltransferase
MNIDILTTRVGWAVSVGSGRTLAQLSLGYKTRRDAIRAVRPELRENATYESWYPELTESVLAYLEGEPVDFRSVKIDLSHLTDFGRRVIRACRKIPYGETCTYGELARAAGSPGAARAVGSRMAHNRTILVVPCHRVVGGNNLGGFSGPGGLTLKKKLLELET